jgi:hypothetical protein
MSKYGVAKVRKEKNGANVRNVRNDIAGKAAK